MNLLRSNKFLFSIPVLLYIAYSSKFFVSAQRVYSTKEKSALEKFRPLVFDKLTSDIQRRDGYLLRWIRAYEFDLKKAQTHLEKTLKWRKENNMDTILDGIPDGAPKDLPYTIEGIDRNDRPLLIMYFGKWLLRKYVVAGKTKDASKQFKIMQERVLRKIFENAEITGKDIDQFYYLVEFQGYNRKENLCVACVPLTLDFSVSFDSGMSPFIANLTLINVPRYFQPVLTLVKEVFGLLALKSLNDFESNKAEWQPAVLSDIAPENLPKSIGGR